MNPEEILARDLSSVIIERARAEALAHSTRAQLERIMAERDKLFAQLTDVSKELEELRAVSREGKETPAP